MELMDLITFLQIFNIYNKNNFIKSLNFYKKKALKEPFLLFFQIKSLYFFASGSKFCKFGPAINPTSPNKTSEPIPNPAAQGLKPPKAKDAKKFIILKKH